MPILDWMTRGDDVMAAARVPYRMLEAVPGLDGGDGDPANMLIQGDNLGRCCWSARWERR